MPLLSRSISVLVSLSIYPRYTLSGTTTAKTQPQRGPGGTHNGITGVNREVKQCYIPTSGAILIGTQRTHNSLI